MDDDRPVVMCFVAFPVTDRWVSGPALVPLEVALDLKTRGWWVVGPDPADEIALASYERAQAWNTKLSK